MQFLSFRDIAAYGEESTPGVGGGQAFPAFWRIITNKNYGGPVERDAAILKYLNETIMLLLDWKEKITRVQRYNAMLYRGRHYSSQDEMMNLPYVKNRQINKNHAKIVLNYIGKAVDDHVSAMAGYEPNVATMPVNEEEGDRVNAREAKEIIDYYNEFLGMKLFFERFHRRKKIQGETFGVVDWDPDLGDYHPAYKELRRMKQEEGGDPDEPIPLTDPETGQQIVGEDGDPIFITTGVRVGDLKIRHEYSERMLYPCPESYEWDDVPYFHNLIWMTVDEVKARWPKHADNIKADGMFRRHIGPVGRSLEQKVCVRYTYHKPTTFLDPGFYAYSTETVLLESGPKLFNHDRLPCIRGTDIDLEYEITGMSFIQNLVSLNQAINNSTSMILQNQALFAYPKYTSPRGAKVRFTDLGDDRGIYEYSGPKQPELMVNNSTPGDVWKWRDAMRDEFKTFANIFAPSQGHAPDGITANVALRMIDEEERKAHKPAIDKHSNNVELLWRLGLTTLATYRDPSDGAMIQIIGKNNERYLKYFDVANLEKPVTIKVVRSSGLPENPAARTQTVLDLNEAFPGTWKGDEVLETLDIAKPDKMIESATLSRRAAESEVEDILEGLGNVPPPQEYHDILPRYRVYEKAVQSRAFEEAAPQIKQRMINQIITAEYIISKKIGNNPTFEQIVLMAHPNFPMFFPKLQAAPTQFALAEPPPSPTEMAGAAPMGGIDPAAAANDPSQMPAEEQPPPGPSPMPASPPTPQAPSPGALP